MNKSGFWVAYFLLLVAQILLSNYFRFTPYVTLSILPIMVLCISTRIKTPWCMLIAFVSGLAVDWLSRETGEQMQATTIYVDKISMA